MGERETTLERNQSDVGVSLDGAEHAETTDTGSTPSRRERLRARVPSVFSVRWFAITLAVTLVGFVLGGSLFTLGGLLPLGGLANLFGIAAGTFLTGALASTSRYTESAIGGASVVGVASLLDHLALTLGGLGLPIVAVGVGSGFLAGLLGHYFGRDLRAGLTRDV